MILVLLLVLAWLYGWGLRTPGASGGLSRFRLLLGVFLVLASWLPARSLLSPRAGFPSPDWRPYSLQARQGALAEKRPVMIDFYADWCIPCKELDRFSFSDPGVLALSKEFLALKADLTRSESTEVLELTRHFQIKGVPTIVFLDASGKELEDLRLVHFENAVALRKRMSRALGREEP
jgi:thiol:disulfide interchange protein DsbD